MNGDPRGPFDDEIAADLSSLAPHDVDANAALAAMRPALRRARSRHRLAVSSGAVGAIVVVLGVGGLLAGRNSSHINVQQHSTTLSAGPSTPSTRRPASTTTLPPTTSTSMTTPFPPHSTSTAAPPTNATPTTRGSGGSPGPKTGSTTVPKTTSTTVPPNAPGATKTYTSIGGRIAVTFRNGSLTLDSSTPSAGYQYEVHTNTPDDVEVRFSNGNHESRIRIRVQDGRLTKEITEN